MVIFLKKAVNYTHKTDTCALYYYKEGYGKNKYIVINGLADKTDSNTVITIPKEIGGVPVKTINSHAFYNTDIEKVILPEGLEKIGNKCFAHCTHLNEINFPSTLTYIGKEAFVYSDLTSVVLNDGLTALSEGVFRSSANLVNVSLPESLIRIDREAFRDTAIENIRFNSSLKVIGQSAFEDCDLLKNIEFNEGLRCIEKDAFFDCRALKNIRLPESLETLGYAAFDQCSSLGTIYVGKNLHDISIDMDFLYGCSELREIKVNPDNEIIKDIDGVLYDSKVKTLIRIPPSLENKTLIIPASVEHFNSCSFEGVCLNKIIIKSKSISGMTDSCFEPDDIKKICCPPDSDISKRFKRLFNIDTTPPQSKLDSFLEELNEEKII